MKIRQELIEHPDSFATKAKELSEDKETAKNGGLVPFFSKGTYDKAFEKAAFLLKNDGDISEPAVTDRGIELFRRSLKSLLNSSHLKPLRMKSESLLIVEKFKEEFSEAMGSLVDQGAMTLHLRSLSRPMERSRCHVDIQGEKSKAAKALFGLHEKGSMTSYYDNNTAVVVKLDELHKREIPAP